MTPVLYVILCIIPAAIATILALTACAAAGRADEQAEKELAEMEAKQ